jgi:hypothetical protein
MKTNILKSLAVLVIIMLTCGFTPAQAKLRHRDVVYHEFARPVMPEGTTAEQMRDQYHYVLVSVATLAKDNSWFLNETPLVGRNKAIKTRFLPGVLLWCVDLGNGKFEPAYKEVCLNRVEEVEEQQSAPVQRQVAEQQYVAPQQAAYQPSYQSQPQQWVQAPDFSGWVQSAVSAFVPNLSSYQSSSYPSYQPAPQQTQTAPVTVNKTYAPTVTKTYAPTNIYAPTNTRTNTYAPIYAPTVNAPKTVTITGIHTPPITIPQPTPCPTTTPIVGPVIPSTPVSPTGGNNAPYTPFGKAVTGAQTANSTSTPTGPVTALHASPTNSSFTAGAARTASTTTPASNLQAASLSSVRAGRAAASVSPSGANPSLAAAPLRNRGGGQQGANGARSIRGSAAQTSGLTATPSRSAPVFRQQQVQRQVTAGPARTAAPVFRGGNFGRSFAGVARGGGGRRR